MFLLLLYIIPLYNIIYPNLSCLAANSKNSLAPPIPVLSKSLSEEAQNLQQIMPHEWDPMFSPVPLLRNEQRDPDGTAAVDEQADVEDDEGTSEATETGLWKRKLLGFQGSDDL